MTTLKEAWDVINTAERTQRHCMMLENCVYDFFELTTLNMAQQGLFGDVLSAKGAYIHNLEPFWKYYEGNWRLKFNQDEVAVMSMRHTALAQLAGYSISTVATAWSTSPPWTYLPPLSPAS